MTPRLDRSRVRRPAGQDGRVTVGGGRAAPAANDNAAPLSRNLINALKWVGLVAVLAGMATATAAV